MPKGLMLTVMSHNQGWLERFKSTIEKVSPDESRSFRYHEIDYDTGWGDFMRNVIHGGDMDISEIGSSWINDFAAMNSLRPFSSAEIENLGGEAAFQPGLWHSGVSENGTVYAVPWMTYLSLVYYRRDIFKIAGVDETDAFSTPEKLEQTLAQLSRAGISFPWAIPTRSKYTTLHNLSMWLWSKGTDFVDPSGKTVLLDEPDGRIAMHSYFSLYRYLSPKARGLTDLEADDLFSRGEAAVTISGPSLYSLCRSRRLGNVGVAIPLGRSIVGGSSLVIWNSSELWKSAIHLISLLSGRGVQTSLPKAAGMLPGRLDMLEHFRFSEDSEINRIVSCAIKTGRSLPRVPLLGMIEERLAKSFEQLWNSLLISHEADLALLLDQVVISTVRRINLALSI